MTFTIAGSSPIKILTLTHVNNHERRAAALLLSSRTQIYTETRRRAVFAQGLSNTE